MFCTTLLWKAARNSSVDETVAQPPTQCHHAPAAATSGPYGVTKSRLCCDEIEHGPPLSSGSPVTLTSIEVTGICPSEYSSANRSCFGLRAVAASAVDGVSVSDAPARTMKV